MDGSITGGWKRGRLLSLWRYTDRADHYPGWHLTAPAPSCAALVDVLDAMAATGAPSRKEFRVTPPTAPILRVPNNFAGKAPWASVDTLALVFPHVDVSADHWHLSSDPQQLTLTLGAARLQELRLRIAGLAEGADDCWMGASGTKRRSEMLWFWRFPV